MDNNLDNILNSIKQLSTGDKLRILYFLKEEQNKKPTQEEIVSFFSEETKKLENWNQEVDKLLEETGKFFSELNKSI
ncbi:MAG: hypothetical protein A3I68_00165 [Candidatus Melainabacteria bacterium RIFCSPLOWO2_02_FULL_35_15]|nr:MAG: hypothetical protein A3F80_00945 [Candidatus Melainabacteria bacterium RIFCSPLOWO2_12_FULL_35_11]OGI14808.1 MAG: hypothetical protein A3I68_00165 [Candidatus Melainabacteria bacterium RIFCSPLOWO2_02_FULL_35_15]